MGLHHACGREMYTDRAHVDKLVEQEIDTGIGQRGVANGRTNALIRLSEQLLRFEMLIGSIAPIVLSHFFVHAFGCCLGQSFAQNLGHHLLVVVVFVVVFDARIHRSGERSHLIFNAT